MRIVFKALIEAKADLVALLETRSRRTLDAVLRAQFILEDIEDQILKTGQPPVDAHVIRVGEQGYWWLYIDGIWLGFRRVETSSGLFKFRTRTVTLHSAAATLPHV